MRGQTISYMELAVVLMTKLQLLTITHVLTSPLEYVSIILIGLFLISYPVACALVLLCSRHKFDDPDFQERWSFLYINLRYKGKWTALMYYPMFILKRLAFVLIPICIYEGFQQL
jgi:hypothetical protein